MKTFVVPDMHGHYDTLKALLKEAGVLDHQGHRVPDENVTVVSLGDLANAVATDVHGDIQCLRTVGDWIDLLLMGNHEHPYFGGPAFGGFWRYPEVEVELRRIEAENKLSPAYVIQHDEMDIRDAILVSHAGLVDTDDGDAVDAYVSIYDAYAAEGWRHPLFTTIGPHRGGWARYGGLLWSDWMEAKNHNFNQIVGHTPQRKEKPPRRDYANGRWSICIDMGAKSGTGATGVWVDEKGALEFVSVRHKSNHF